MISELLSGPASTPRSAADALATETPTLELTGVRGLLTEIVRQFLQTSLDAEFEHFLARQLRTDALRNGYYERKVATDVGEVRLRVPRTRRRGFQPVSAPNYARRVGSLGSEVLRIYASAATTRDVRAQIHDLFDGALLPDVLAVVADRTVEAIVRLRTKPLRSSYELLAIDAVTAGRGRHVNPIWVVAGIDTEGTARLLSLSMGGPRFGPEALLAGLSGRGVRNPTWVACTAVEGDLPAVTEYWPQATFVPEIEQLVRNSLRPQQEP
jgi:putative transposase